MSLGLESGTVRLVPHDPAWAALFAAEAERLRAELGPDLAFRDALREQPATRDAYATLKLDLAGRYPRDREAYIEGKGPFVRQVVARVLARSEGPG